MTNQFIHLPKSEESSQYLHEELLELILEEEEVYPWDPTTMEAEAYFSQIESQFSLADALDTAEMTDQADLLFSSLDHCWSAVDHPPISDSLWQKFSQLVPLTWLETITAQAKLLSTENITQLAQLVECVKPLWMSWKNDDLEVFARPLVYAMRGEYPIKPRFWQELSEIEQIRLSMFIAREVIEEVRSGNLG